MCPNYIRPLVFDGQNAHLLGLGHAGAGSVFEITPSSEIAQQHAISTNLEAALSQSNSTVTHVAHGPAGGGANILYVGTDRGLLVGETTTVRDEFEPDWRFYYTPESTPYPASIDELRSLSLGIVANPAEVRAMVLDGPTLSNAQSLWFGTPSGVHILNLVDDTITHSGLLEHPGVEGRYVREYNNIRSLHVSADELLVGSIKGMWAISGDYSAVYGYQNQEPIYGEIVAIDTIEIDGKDVTSLPMYRRAHIGIGYLPQEASIFRGLTVEGNLNAVLEISIKDHAERRKKLDSLLAEFSIAHIRQASAISLSGGERRRVEIARCLASQPKYILLDEPFAGVDPIAVNEIRSLVSHLRNRDIGILITDHNVRETLEIIDRAYILHDGNVLMSGTPEEVVQDTTVRHVYLGDNYRA